MCYDGAHINVKNPVYRLYVRVDDKERFLLIQRNRSKRLASKMEATLRFG